MVIGSTKEGSPKHGLARVLSKLGICSRTQATALIVAGRVSVNGNVQVDPERATDMQRDQLAIDGNAVAAGPRVYIALNKPRGLIVSSADERGRDTVYSLLADAELPWLAPVGRLDKASEGLLLMSNDPQWAARITDPVHQLHKTYHVQINGIPDATSLEVMQQGVHVDSEHLSVVRASLLRAGKKNAWLEVTLDEGRNRHLRRLLQTLNYEVLRLVRIVIGDIELGELAKGSWRHLTENEMRSIK